MKNYKVSTNFSSKEFRCPCCGKLSLYPPLVAHMQELRDIYGDPLTTTQASGGGGRCSQLTKKMWKEGKGSQFSMHEFTEDHPHCAVDLKEVKELGLKGMIRFMVLETRWHEKGSMGVYLDRRFVHVDLRTVMWDKKPTFWIDWGENMKFYPFADWWQEVRSLSQ
jgi:hypothetical protein